MEGIRQYVPNKILGFHFTEFPGKVLMTKEERADHLEGKEEERFLYNGNSFFIPHLKEKPDDKELVRMYNREGNFIALYRYIGKTERFETEKMFLNDRQ